MGQEFYDRLGYLIVWIVPIIVIIRFRKAFWALYLESRSSGRTFSSFLFPVRQYADFKKGHIQARTKWAEEIIEQEKYRKINK